MTLVKNARPDGPGTAEVVKISGLVGTITTSPENATPLLFKTNGYFVPVTIDLRPSGTTNVTSLLLTDFKPHITPLIESVTPLNSIGSSKLLASEPIAVLGVMGTSIAGVKLRYTSIPGDIPNTSGGVTGVAVGAGVGVGDTVADGDGDGVGVGVGVGVGEPDGVGDGVGVGLGETEIANRLAPVAKLYVAVVSEFCTGL